MSDGVRAETVQLLLQRLELLITRSRTLPGGRAVVRVEEALEIVDRIRRSMPVELQEAQALSARREQILQDSQAEAERIVLKAEEYAAQLVRESEVLKQAQEEANRLLDEYRERATRLEADANEYADTVLLMVEQALGKSLSELERHLHQVQRGREELNRRLQETAGETEAGQPAEASPPAS